MINELTEQRILDEVRVTDILEDSGIALHKSGANLTALCPFHEDRHLGSFIISESKNICTCYAGCGSFNAKQLVARLHNWDLKKDYVKILRYMAAVRNIPVDDEPAPRVHKVAIARPKPVELPMVVFDQRIIQPSLHRHNECNLGQYLLNLPLSADDSARRKLMMELYLFGTSTNGRTAGWTIWWQLDADKRVRNGHLMAYKPNGRRDKQAKPYIQDGQTMYYNNDWVARLLKKQGVWNDTTHRTRPCLFGEHLVDVFPNAEICIVESEKTALICSFFTDPGERLWMATAGMQNFKRELLQPLIDRQRYIVLYPDIDGYDKWEAMADNIRYPRLSVSGKVRELWEHQDGDKADIADIMLRRLRAFTETEADIAARRLGCPERAAQLAEFMDVLQLKID